MKWRLKIVPNVEPNADGAWITVDKTGHPPPSGWRGAVEFFKHDVPTDHHLVGYEREDR